MQGLDKITDECSKCDEILQCDLCKLGHSYNAERKIKAQMIECQMKHIEQRWGDKRKWE